MYPVQRCRSAQFTMNHWYLLCMNHRNLLHTDNANKKLRKPKKNCGNQNQNKGIKNYGIKWWDRNEIKMRTRKQEAKNDALLCHWESWVFTYSLYQSTARSAAALPEEQPDSVFSVVKWSTVAASLRSLTATQGSPTHSKISSITETEE